MRSNNFRNFKKPKSRKQRVNRLVVRRLVELLQRGLSEFEFEEILAALPEAMDLFTDEQVDELLKAVKGYSD